MPALSSRPASIAEMIAGKRTNNKQLYYVFTIVHIIYTGVVFREGNR